MNHPSDAAARQWRKAPSQEGCEGLDFDDFDAMGSEPVAHPRPRVGLPLLPRPHALGRNDQTRQLLAVGGLDDPRQIGPRGS